MGNRAQIIANILFLLLVVWWVVGQLFSPYGSPIPTSFGHIYGVIALIGGIVGFKMAIEYWGGHKSHMGKAILMFSIGLLCQTFGQIYYSADYLITGNYDFPKWGEIGFFSSLLLYILGSYQLLKLSSGKAKSSRISRKLISITIPITLLSAVYYIFLWDYQFQESSIINIFLDFIYPLGDSIFLAFGILAYIRATGGMDGLMRNRLRLFLLALIAQFIADFVFFYNSIFFGIHNTIPGELYDLMFLIAYFVMLNAIFYLSSVGIFAVVPKIFMRFKTTP